MRQGDNTFFMKSFLIKLKFSLIRHLSRVFPMMGMIFGSSFIPSATLRNCRNQRDTMFHEELNFGDVSQPLLLTKKVFRWVIFLKEKFKSFRVLRQTMKLWKTKKMMDRFYVDMDIGSEKVRMNELRCRYWRWSGRHKLGSSNGCQLSHENIVNQLRGGLERELVAPRFFGLLSEFRELGFDIYSQSLESDAE